MVKIIVVKKWDEAETMRMVTLIKMGRSIAEIWQYWPDCTRRQIEHRVNTLCHVRDLPRPTRKKARRSDKRIAQDKHKAVVTRTEWKWDFSQHEANVGRT